MDDLAPPVVAVIVTCDPGPWFEDTLRSFAAQDYPELSVLVLDAASVVDPTPRVAAVLPGAFVRRLPENHGFAASVDAVLGMVAGASHLLLCHDDVALDPDVVQVLVEESFRCNAGVVGPKLVGWEDPTRLLHVGMGVDKGGTVVDRVEPGEIDHGQHDAVQDVFLAPGGCLLVRADLFVELGGLDPAVVALGDDLDLCWRAQVAGARVVVAPAARVRHLERLAGGERPLPVGAPSLQALQRRHELRVVLVCYSRFHLLRVLPQLLALSAGEFVLSVLTGHRRRAADLWHAWSWNWSRRKEIRAARAALGQHRRLNDTELRRLQLHGSARLNAYLRRLFAHGLDAAHAGAGAAVAPPSTVSSDAAALSAHLSSVTGVALKEIALEDAAARGEVPLANGASSTEPAAPPAGAVLAGDGTGASGSDGADVAGGTGVGSPGGAAFDETASAMRRRSRSRSGRVITWTVVVLVLLVGSRQLLGGGLPSIAGLLPLPSWSTLLHRFAVGWQAPGLGTGDPVSPATGPLGVAALLLFGSSGLLQKVIVLGCLPVGAWGVSRLVRPFASTRARVAATVAYLALPVAYDALAQGRWDALVAYAAVPWIVNRLARASGLEPFASALAARSSSGSPSARPRRHLRFGWQVLGLAVIEAVFCSLAPAGAAVTLMVALALALGGVLVLGRAAWRPVSRMLGMAVASTALAVVLLAPWSLTLLAGPQRWQAVTGLVLAPGSGPTWGALLRLAIGPVGDTPLAYGLVAAASLCLVVGARHRLTWAGMAWSLIGSAWVLAWAEGRGFTGAFAVDPQMLLVPAAVGVALGIGLGVVAFEQDLPGFRFGWRQAATAAAAAMALLGGLPVLAAAGGGRWDLPLSGYGQATAWFATKAPPGGFRVLWLADPRAVPGGGWQLGAGVAYALSDGGLPDLTGLWAGSEQVDGVGSVQGALTLAERNGTVQLGRALAGEHIRYVVVVEGLAPEIPGYQTAPTFAVPNRLTDALAAQADLSQVPGQGGLEVYIDTVSASGRLGSHAGSSWAYRGGEYAEVAVWLIVLAVVLERLTRPTRRRRHHQRSLPDPSAVRHMSVAVLATPEQEPSRGGNETPAGVGG